MNDYKNHIKLMIGKKGQPIPLHVMIVSGDKGVGKTYQAEQILSKQNVREYEIVTGSPFRSPAIQVPLGSQRCNYRP